MKQIRLELNVYEHTHAKLIRLASDQKSSVTAVIERLVEQETKLTKAMNQGGNRGNAH
jgi:predicted CopG family antitoxin